MEELVPIPTGVRTFASRRVVRLADMDVWGRVRLDAIARYLQDVAIEDVDETGWGTPDHLWFIRSIRVDVLAPLRRGPRGGAGHVVQRARRRWPRDDAGR